MLRTPQTLLEKFLLASGEEICSDNIPRLPEGPEPEPPMEKPMPAMFPSALLTGAVWQGLEVQVRKLFSPWRQGGRMTHLMLFSSYPHQANQQLAYVLQKPPHLTWQRWYHNLRLLCKDKWGVRKDIHLQRMQWLVSVLLCRPWAKFLLLYVL